MTKALDLQKPFCLGTRLYSCSRVLFEVFPSRSPHNQPHSSLLFSGLFALSYSSPTVFAPSLVVFRTSGPCPWSFRSYYLFPLVVISASGFLPLVVTPARICRFCTSTPVLLSVSGPARRLLSLTPFLLINSMPLPLSIKLIGGDILDLEGTYYQFISDKKNMLLLYHWRQKGMNRNWNHCAWTIINMARRRDMWDSFHYNMVVNKRHIWQVTVILTQPLGWFYMNFLNIFLYVFDNACKNEPSRRLGTISEAFVARGKQPMAYYRDFRRNKEGHKLWPVFGRANARKVERSGLETT